MKRLVNAMIYLLPALVALGVFLLFVSSPLDDADIEVGTSAVTSGLVVVIDPGHGGEDGGAVSPSGVKESTLNLDIAEKLDLILAFYGVHTVMTRTSETLDYSESADTIREKKREDQNRRIDLIDSLDNAVVISIHQNNYPSAGPFGAQAFYAPTDGSKAFAEYLQQLLVSALKSGKQTVSRTDTLKHPAHEQHRLSGRFG